MSLLGLLIVLMIIYIFILIIEKLWLPITIITAAFLLSGIIYLLGIGIINLSKWISTSSSSLVNNLIRILPGGQNIPATNISIPWIIPTIIFIVGLALSFWTFRRKTKKYLRRKNKDD